MAKVLEGRDASLYLILPTDSEGVKKKKRERRRTLELNMKYLAIQDIMSRSASFLLLGENIPPVETKRLSKEYILDLVVRSIRAMEGVLTSLDKHIADAIEVIAREQEQIQILTGLIEQHQAGMGS